MLSFTGLHALVTEQLGEDPRTGALFVFTNRRHTRLKILLFDGTGLGAQHQSQPAESMAAGFPPSRTLPD